MGCVCDRFFKSPEPRERQDVHEFRGSKTRWREPRCRKYGASRWGGMVASAVSRGKKPVDTVVGELTEDTALEEGQFRELLEKIDRGLRALPATAQARRALC